MPRTNILFITADQQRADCIGIEGRNIKTPHLDQLCREGTRFTSAITPCVVCQPARASILTGQLPRTHGVHDNGIDLNPEIGEKGFAGTLSAVGYNTGFFGKAHFSTYHTFAPTGTPECLRSSADYPDSWFGPYMGFQHVEMMLEGDNWFLPEKPPAGQHYERWFYADGKGDEQNRLYQENAGDTKEAAQTWHSRLPVAWHNSTWTADRTINWLTEQAQQDKPFCAWVSFSGPHHPFDAPEPWSYLHNPDEVDLPKHRQRGFEGRPWWHEQALSVKPADTTENAETRDAYSRTSPQSDDQLRQIIANTYDKIALVDHQLGRIMASLEELGLAENTLIVYASDHGDWLGDHGLIFNGPMHYEGVLRVPLIMKGPGVPAGQINDNPVSTLDLSATFADLVGTQPLLRQHGRSLLPLLKYPDAGRVFALNEWELLPTHAGAALSLRTVRTKTAKMTVDLISGAGELYDLATDPDELINQFDNPQMRPLRDELMEMLETRPDDCLPHQTQVGRA